MLNKEVFKYLKSREIRIVRNWKGKVKRKR
jgi:hypothetical protein